MDKRKGFQFLKILDHFINYREADKPVENQTNTNALQEIIDLLPGHVYWYDKDGIYYGCNDQQAKALGFKKSKDLIGKCFYEMQSSEHVDAIKRTNETIYHSGEQLSIEERAFFNNKECTFLSKKLPWRDKTGEIIGIIGISFDITEEEDLKKELLKEKSQVENTLKNILDNVSGHIYVKDLEGRYIFCNEEQAESLGLEVKDIIGKTDYDLSSKDKADKFKEADQTVIRTNQVLTVEEKIISRGLERIVLSKKAPLKNEKGEVIGLLGISIDITDRKEKESLQLETKIQKNLLEEQQKNKKIIDQYAHDVQSPVSGAMMILNKCAELPENKRIPLRTALTRINEMTRNLLKKYHPDHNTDLQESIQPVLVSMSLLEILTEKSFEYENLAIKFDHSCDDYFTFIRIEPNAFKRSLSNLINNAVEALEKAQGKIILKLEVFGDQVQIVIQDNGRGMSPELITKILNNVAISEGKREGHGIGLAQVRETLQRNGGTLTIDSKLGLGTKLVLSFPKSPAPDWINDSIILGDQDIVVVLDDEESIKDAWRAQFQPLLKLAPLLEPHYFANGQEALDFIAQLNPDEKTKVFLLTDYELFDQPLTGLDVIERANIKRSVLVTSHYANAEIQKRAMQLKTRILPKQLAQEVPINVSLHYHYEDPSHSPKANIVIVDDDQEFASCLQTFIFTEEQVSYFNNPDTLLTRLADFSTDTKICLDNDFNQNNGMSGIDLAKILYKRGYQQLFLLSGHEFKPGELPDYLTGILKTDLEKIQKIIA